jgi:hypothetical protein
MAASEVVPKRAKDVLQAVCTDARGQATSGGPSKVLEITAKSRADLPEEFGGYVLWARA